MSLSFLLLCSIVFVCSAMVVQHIYACTHKRGKQEKKRERRQGSKMQVEIVLFDLAAHSARKGIGLPSSLHHKRRNTEWQMQESKDDNDTKEGGVPACD